MGGVIHNNHSHSNIAHFFYLGPHTVPKYSQNCNLIYCFLLGVWFGIETAQCNSFYFHVVCDIFWGYKSPNCFFPPRNMTYCYLVVLLGGQLLKKIRTLLSLIQFDQTISRFEAKILYKKINVQKTCEKLNTIAVECQTFLVPRGVINHGGGRGGLI